MFGILGIERLNKLTIVRESVEKNVIEFKKNPKDHKKECRK